MPAAGLHGAYEFAYRLEGRGAVPRPCRPVIAATAALIPPIAEPTWRDGGPLRPFSGGPFWFRLVSWSSSSLPSGSTVQRPVLRPSAVPFAALLLEPRQHSPAKRAWPRREPRANAARAQKQCGPVCRTKLAAEAAAQADVDAGRRELLSAESKATADSPLQAPVWLLPVALDLVAFMAIWSGLTG
jgi:hypothetical protein